MKDKDTIIIEMVGNGFVVRPPVPEGMACNSAMIFVFETYDSLSAFLKGYFLQPKQPKP